MGNAAAASAQGVGRAQHHRIADGIGKCDTVLDVLYHLGGSHRLADLFHGFLKLQTVLCLLNGLGSGSDQAYVIGL